MYIRTYNQVCMCVCVCARACVYVYMCVHARVCVHCFYSAVYNMINCFLSVCRILVLIVLSPLLQMAVFALAYGREAEDLKFYYTNYDSMPGYYKNVFTYLDKVSSNTINVAVFTFPMGGSNRKWHKKITFKFMYKGYKHNCHHGDVLFHDPSMVGNICCMKS